MSKAIPCNAPFHPYAIMGGTFDPVHQGHIDMATHVHTQLCAMGVMPHTVFMPTPLSPLKKTKTSAKHRVAMLKRALRDTPFSIDRAELNGPCPASSFDTFSTLRAQHGLQQPFIFIIGQDSLDTIHTWHGHTQFLNMVHFWIFPRMATSAHHTVMLPDFLASARTQTLRALIEKPCGCVWVDETHPSAISSTTLRQDKLAQKQHLNTRVRTYIRRAHLY